MRGRRPAPVFFEPPAGVVRPMPVTRRVCRLSVLSQPAQARLPCHSCRPPPAPPVAPVLRRGVFMRRSGRETRTEPRMQARCPDLPGFWGPQQMPRRRAILLNRPPPWRDPSMPGRFCARVFQQLSPDAVVSSRSGAPGSFPGRLFANKNPAPAKAVRGKRASCAARRRRTSVPPVPAAANRRSGEGAQSRPAGASSGVVCLAPMA